MKKLEQLTKDESGQLFRANKTPVRAKFLLHKGKIKTIVVPNPSHCISLIFDEMAERDSAFIPKGANAYVASKFNGDTQHVRKSEESGEKIYSVYGIQFYYVCNSFSRLILL